MICPVNLSWDDPLGEILQDVASCIVNNNERDGQYFFAVYDTVLWLHSSGDDKTIVKSAHS